MSSVVATTEGGQWVDSAKLGPGVAEIIVEVQQGSQDRNLLEQMKNWALNRISELDL